MAEDAAESAGAKAPAITISTQQTIAGEGVLMSVERCAAVHLASSASILRRSDDAQDEDDRGERIREIV